MPYKFSFSPNSRYPYESGSLFLGVDPQEGYEVGIETERHAITIAGAGSGKGAALIIPNLLRWPHNALVIDPKGEAAQHTAEARERMGQKIYILDPFQSDSVKSLPDRFRARLNPLDGLDPAALDAREGVNVLADGLVQRFDTRAGFWDNGGLTIIAGMIAHVLTQAPPERRNLAEVRRMLTAPPDAFKALVAAMQTNTACANLAAAAASKLTKTGTEAAHFLSVADENTKWLDSPAMADLLSASTFHLSDLKTKPCTIYLVLPAHMLNEHGRFLRLFVRMALNAMARGGTGAGRRTLFLLDEFYSLGRIDEIAKAAGLMRGYGVSLWPILQDLGQLESLYGREEKHTFFGNSDAHIFMGNTDAMTLDYISARIGPVSHGEVAAPPDRKPFLPSFWRGDYSLNGGKTRLTETNLAKWQTEQDNIQRRHQYETAGVGSPRFPADDVREHVKKLAPDQPSEFAIVLAYGRDILSVRLMPYFAKARRRAAPQRRGFWGFLRSLFFR